MGDDITIGVTEIVNNIEVTAQPNDQIVDISVTDNADNVTLNITPTVVEVNINKGSSFAQWGDLYGTLSDQTDLQNALLLKADLVDGKVPAYQLPSFVDDIIEVANYAALPATGEIGKIYVTLDNNKIYRWSGSIYIEIAANNAIWGAITGTLTDQTDLVTALNAKQNTITLTTTGTTGAATLVGSTLNIPNYTTDISGLVPYTGATTNVDLGIHKLTASDLVINHVSGSGVAASITKGGNGEALTVVKSSGSGNAASITGGTTLISELHLTTDLADDYIASAATWNAKQSALSGTGFVKISGTTISYDNSTYALDSAVVKLTGDQSITGSKSFTTNTAAPAMVVTNNSTDNGILLQNTSTGRGITSNNVSTGIGIRSDNTGGGTGISSSNTGAGTGIVSTNTSTTGSALSISNSSTGYGILLTNSTGTGISSSNTGSGTGFYSNNSSTGNGIQSINSSSGYGISSSNTGSGRGIYSSNNSTGDAINIANSGSGRGIYLTNASSGNSLILNNGTSATGMPFTVSKNGTDKFTINDAGEATGVKFIKSGGTSSQFLKADGSVDSTTYQAALTNPVTGTGTTNYIPKFTGASAIGNSLIYDNGTNVGIGTTSPTVKLVVDGGSSDYTPIWAKSSLLAGSKYYSSLIAGYALTANQSAQFGYVYDTVTATNSYAHITPFGSAEGSKFIVRADGNVGIGTTSPTSKLHVVGDVYSSGYFNSNNIYLGKGSDLFTGGSANDGGLMVSGSNNLIFGNALTERMRITSNGELLIGRTSSYGAGWQLAVEGNIYAKNDLRIDANASFGGNVGIGTTSPSERLHLKNTVGTGTFIRFEDAGGGGSYVGTRSGNIEIYAGDSERMRITSGGNVYVNATSGLYSAFGYAFGVKAASGNQTYLSIATPSQTLDSEGLVIGVNADDASIILRDNKPLDFWTNNTNRMRITSGGNLCIGTTSTTLSTTSVSAAFGVGGDATLKLGGYGGSTHTQVQFIHTGSVQGSIVTTNGAGTAYNTSSDYRLKEDLKPINGLDLISQINVYDYKWKSNETRAYGVLAHELQEVIPQAVSGEKDSENMQGVDYSKLVPILVQAIQDQQKQIDELKTLINK